MNINRKGLFILIITVNFLLLLSGCNKVVAQKEGVKVVVIKEAGIETLNVYNEYASKVKAENEVMISPKIPGKVEEVRVIVGQEVETGQVLFTLDKNDIEDQIRTAKAAVNTSSENLRIMSDSTVPLQRLASESNVNQLRNQLNDFTKTYNEAKANYQDIKIDKRQFEDIETRYESLKIQLKAAEDNLKIFNDTTSKKMVNIAESQVEQAQAALSQVNTQYNNLEVKAPMSGIISVCDIKKGVMVSPSMSALTIIGKTLYLETLLSDNVISKIKQDQKTSINITSIEDKTYNGTISSISPNSDPRTSLYTVKVRIDDIDSKIKTGMVAKLTLIVGNREKVLTVQNKAILVDDGVKYVFIVNNQNVAEKKIISLGLTADKLTEVTAGLKAGDKVVIEGHVLINNGDKVKIN
jgi:HlyD family secretion protein